MGDFIRGVNISQLPESIARGVQNHQAVDRFTDSHAGVKRLKASFSDQRRRYAGIILDVVFDHFLIKHWRMYSKEDLGAFTDYCYESLLSFQHMMPERMSHRVEWMVRFDLLNSYAELKGIANALNGISGRIRFENRLAGAIEEVADHYEILQQGFMEFFAELRTHVRDLKIEEPDSADNSVLYSHRCRRL